jgi:hypothetical protein
VRQRFKKKSTETGIPVEADHFSRRALRTIRSGNDTYSPEVQITTMANIDMHQFLSSLLRDLGAEDAPTTEQSVGLGRSANLNKHRQRDRLVHVVQDGARARHRLGPANNDAAQSTSGESSTRPRPMKKTGKPPYRKMKANRQLKQSEISLPGTSGVHSNWRRDEPGSLSWALEQQTSSLRFSEQHRTPTCRTSSGNRQSCQKQSPPFHRFSEKEQNPSCQNVGDHDKIPTRPVRSTSIDKTPSMPTRRPFTPDLTGDTRKHIHASHDLQ